MRGRWPITGPENSENKWSLDRPIESQMAPALRSLKRQSNAVERN